MNINRYLTSAKRTSVIGKNIYSAEGYLGNRKNYNLPWGTEWKTPTPGLTDVLYIGHCTQLKELLSLRFFEGEQELNFGVVRHQWTPAWSKTYYRCQPDPSYYRTTGTLSFSETKCFTLDDVFYSEITLSSDKKEPVKVRVRLETSLEDHHVTKEMTRCSTFLLDGYFVQKNSVCEQPEFELELPAQGKVTFSFVLSFDKESDRAKELADETLKSNCHFEEKEQAVNQFFEQNVPVLQCENPDMLRMYYYRWYVVYRSIHSPEDVLHHHQLQGDCIYESPYGEGYDCPIGLPVALHYEECKWMKDPSVVVSDAKNWNRRLDYYWKYYIEQTPMAVWHLYCQHPEKEFLEIMYDSCKVFALKDFSPEKGGYEFLPVTEGSWDTGAEYQPAFYQHTEEPWDWTEDVEGVRKGLSTEKRKLYRLDHISYSVANLIGCAKMAEQLGKSEDSEELYALADRSLNALKTYFWNETKKCFVSIDLKTGKQCDEGICYDSFFPYLWNMIGKEYHEGFSVLFDADSFQGEFSLTTVDMHCPMYWFDNCIAGPTKSSPLEPNPYACAWNGPIWPYATSNTLEALGAVASINSSLKDKWLELFEGYTEVQFLSGDRSTPMVLEHYRPTDGVTFSGTCDYFHSTWIDLFMKYYAGISVNEEGQVVFSPFAQEEFVLDGVLLGGNSYRFEQKKEQGEWKKRMIKLEK